MEGRTAVRFEGNCPRNVSRDARYSIRFEQGQHVVGLVYESQEGEFWYPVSEEHGELAEMVNQVKIEQGATPGGTFYINEYRQVIVPVSGERDYYLAGGYFGSLKFDFEGRVLSGDAVDLDGRPVEPGDAWVGPHPGIPYVLAAGGQDIHYDSEPRPRVRRRVQLSDFRDRPVVRNVCAPIQQVKGYAGGRFYINEFCHLFAPVAGSERLEYVYLGRLASLDEWFPQPHAGGD